MILKRFLLFMFFVLLFLPGLSMPVRAEDEGGNYVIGPGDVITISAWKDEALTRDVTVLPDSKISFPLIGEVVAGGRTVAQLKKEIETKLTPFVPDITLSLHVKQVNSMIIYVIGLVKTPGRFPVNVSVNVLQALSIAGGCSEFAKTNRIKIFRDEGGKTKIYDFHYNNVVKGKQLEENIMLKRGDIVYVP